MHTTFKTGLIVVLCLALWPALVSAKPADPLGKLVYQDDFSDNKKSGLEDNLQATDYSRGFHAPGVYHLKSLKNNETHWSLFPNQNYGTATIELDVWDNSDDFKGDLAEGVIVRAQDDTHFYAVLVDPRKGQYSARKLDGKDKWTDLIAWKTSPLVKQQDGVNHLRVDAEGGKFTIYLNDETLDTFNDTSYAKGGIGLIASNVDAANNHLHFDNVKVYSTEAQPAATQPSTAGAQPATTQSGTAGANAGNLPRTGEQASDGTLLLVACAFVLIGLGAWTRRVHR